MTLLSVKLLVEWLETWEEFDGDTASYDRFAKVKQDTQEYVEKYGYAYDDVNKVWTKKEYVRPQDPSEDPLETTMSISDSATATVIRKNRT